VTCRLHPSALAAGEESEDHLYLNDESHGAALADLPFGGMEASYWR
jgi:hypothetical protein